MASAMLCKSRGSHPSLWTECVASVRRVVKVGAVGLAVVLRCEPRSLAWSMTSTVVLMMGYLYVLRYLLSFGSDANVRDLVGR